jgi:hypothetical protein
MTLDREDILAIADAVVERLFGQSREASGSVKTDKTLHPFDPVKYRLAIIDAQNGNTATLKEYLKTYCGPSPRPS